MKVSELWLRTLIDPPLSAAALADQLTQVGIEIDGSEVVGDKGEQVVWTLKIPANRGDCLSMEGIARELSLLNEMPYVGFDLSKIAAVSLPQKAFPIRVQNPELCPRYLGCSVLDIDPKASTPAWLKDRLELAGIRSLSLIVDILNYVMVELGQPLHAFDLDKLDQELVIRTSVAGEKVQLLNDQVVELQEGTLVIADKSQVHDLAGVMGGLYSAVSKTTRSIFIECAYFNPIAVRLASKRYGLRTEASYRFERGVDPELQSRALQRVLQLVQELAGGKRTEIVELKQDNFIPTIPTVLLRSQRIKTLLGIELPKAKVQGILERGWMNVHEIPEGFRVSPPSYRQDIAIEEDLIEEIARVYGLDQLPTAKMPGSLEYPLPSESLTATSKFKESLISRGYSEAITYSFIDPVVSALFEANSKALTLANPISADMAMMRESLWPGLLQALKYNQHRQCDRVRLFEVGTCFKENNGITQEFPMLAGICAGSLFKEQWGLPAKATDFYDVKSDVEALLTFLGHSDIVFENTAHPALHPGQAAKIMVGASLMGYLGALHPSIQKALSLEGNIYVFELDLANLKQHNITKFRNLSKFPSIRRDLAILLKDSILAEELKSEIKKSSGPFLEDLVIFDVYKGKGIDSTQKSMGVGLILRHPSRTLVEGEVNDIMQDVVSMLKERFQAILRE